MSTNRESMPARFRDCDRWPNGNCRRRGTQRRLDASAVELETPYAPSYSADPEGDDDTPDEFATMDVILARYRQRVKEYEERHLRVPLLDAARFR